MEQSKTYTAEFWAGGAREFYNRTNKDGKHSGIIAFLLRLFPFLKTKEIDKRLFNKK